MKNTEGLSVTAVEISSVAVDKARLLARERRVNVDFVQGDMFSKEFTGGLPNQNFDWVVGIFIQFADPPSREKQFALMKTLTRPGGRILLQGYTPKQLEYRTGGPSALENLYTKTMLQNAFSDWAIEELTEYEDEINEGIGHKGRSALIGLVARKPIKI
jgi:SAM-dependent methyltransferase